MDVKSLISSNKKWKEDTIIQLVTPSDEDHILEIPVEQEHDQLVWPYTKDRKAMVRYVYHRVR